MSQPLPTKGRIYRPARNVMQSGMRKTQQWVLEFIPQDARYINDLTGWTGSRDTTQQLRLSFPTLEAARAYADQHGIAYEVKPPHERVIGPKSYADNFAFNKTSSFIRNRRPRN